jgi:hypothetical protein
LSVAEDLLDVRQTTFKRFRSEFEKRFDGKSVEDAVAELELAMQLLKEVLPRDANKLTMFVQFRHLEIEQREENWMLIEVVNSPRDFPIFPRWIYHNLAVQENRRMIFLMPHPEAEQDQLRYLKSKATPLESNRPSVKTMELPDLTDDGLTNEERESKYHYRVEVNQSLKTFQIETVPYYSVSPGIIDKDLLMNRLPPGIVLSYDQIHRIVGEACKKSYSRFKGEYYFTFSIEPYQHGKFTYSSLTVRASRISD